MHLIEEEYQQLECLWWQSIFLEVHFLVHFVEHVKEEIEASFSQ